MATSKTTKPKYKATIKVLGKTYSSTGKSVEDALAKLDAKGMARANSVLTVESGKKRKEIILPTVVTKRLFNLSPLMREVALKQVATRFDL